VAEPVKDDGDCFYTPEVIRIYRRTLWKQRQRIERAEQIILDLALIHDPRRTRELGELVIAARDWLRKEPERKRGGINKRTA
jgi:hypothetical protein